MMVISGRSMTKRKGESFSMQSLLIGGLSHKLSGSCPNGQSPASRSDDDFKLLVRLFEHCYLKQMSSKDYKISSKIIHYMAELSSIS